MISAPNARAFRWACFGLLLVAWGIDVATPQLFIASILFNAPVALSGLVFDRRFTMGIVIAALLGNASAGWLNGIRDGGVWDALGIADRVLAALSTVLVGYLTSLAQAAAQRAGKLLARQERAERERRLRQAVSVIRSTLNPELVQRNAVREAINVTSADFTMLFVMEDHWQPASTLRCTANDGTVTLSHERLAPELHSLVQRTLAAEGEIVAVSRGDALGRLVLDTLGASDVLAAPILEGERTFGVLLAARSRGEFRREESGLEPLRAFTDQVATAISQAYVFVQLAEKNDELARANAAIAARGDVIRDLVYALSHDLRTPLTAAGMTIRQALDGAYGELPERYREILRRSLEANDELQRLAGTLLMIARYESGESSPVRIRVDLAGLVRSVILELEALAKARGVTLNMETSTPMPVLGDDVELRRAITNLVANALTHSPEETTVRVLLERVGESVALTVEDEGYGVPEKARAALFSRFAGGSSEHGGGTGLGLYLVWRIAKSHSGTVLYTERNPRGSCFTMNLPAAPPPTADQ
ncbi:MAG TPA: HAMP domain-containing sensor histidine kinase [Candidatus Baltobacteraceae bacterium]|jgi:signal transduction histidine kinase|nr:HAMP domain-containing sensor histidine kinase [Candidatus Baltobacteraceae bacterium]